MKIGTTWKKVGLGLALAAVASAATLGPVLADKDNQEDRKKNRPTGNPAYEDPRVEGIVQSTFWADGKKPGQMTATIVIWSNDADMAVSVYGDNPQAREMIVNGTACVGRFIVAIGERIDADAMSAMEIQVPNLDMPCTATLQ